MFGSGCHHCDWLAAGCVVFENGEPVIEPESGLPKWRILLAPREAYEILDTWYTTGLRGTGSTDYRCEELFVPEERSFSFFEPPKREGAIWARPDHFLRKMSGVPLGVAADAIETARGLLADKMDRLTGVPYRDIPRVQSAIGECRALLGAARSYVFASVERQWRKLERGEPLTEEERADGFASRVHAFQMGRRVVSTLYDTIGGSAVYSNKSPFDRHLRDMQTACQHVVAQTKSYEGVGALLLGGGGGHPML
jgi:alkylation response protein AidB-like acyl-CoA dehydrogenase